MLSLADCRLRQVNPSLRWRAPAGCSALAVASLLCVGCVSPVTRITSARDAIPVQSAPPELLAARRSHEVPIDFARLGQTPPSVHRIEAGDLLGIFVHGVLPPADAELAPISTNNLSAALTYPATGQVHGPIVGVPITVSEDGLLPLPLVGSLVVRGLTLSQAAEAVRRAYVVDHTILEAGNDRVIVTLIKRRVHRVLVIREDVATQDLASFINAGAIPFTKRGSSLVVDLPTHENDVLHALVASGGLPGLDAYSELGIMRCRDSSEETAAGSIRIPLRAPPGESIDVQESDIRLHDGDVIYIASRSSDVFYTGGLLPGRQLPLPRDYELNVFDAIAMASGRLAGPIGLNAANINFRAWNAGGTVSATQVIVVRTTPDGERVKIAVDLNRAAADPNERLVIQPNDFIMVQYKPREFAANFALTLLNPFVIINATPGSLGPVVTSAVNAQASTPASSAGASGAGTTVLSGTSVAAAAAVQ